MSICIAAIDEAEAKKSNGGAPVLQRRFFRNSVPSQDDVFFMYGGSIFIYVKQMRGSAHTIPFLGPFGVCIIMIMPNEKPRAALRCRRYRSYMLGSIWIPIYR